MSESNHTPGPWKAEHGDVYGDDPDRWSVFTESNFFVATVENGQPGDTLKTEEANARLIAAAPDLLAACEEYLSLTEDSFLGTPEEAMTGPWHENYRRMKSAVAKAKGVVS